MWFRCTLRLLFNLETHSKRISCFCIERTIATNTNSNKIVFDFLIYYWFAVCAEVIERIGSRNSPNNRKIKRWIDCNITTKAFKFLRITIWSNNIKNLFYLLSCIVKQTGLPSTETRNEHCAAKLFLSITVEATIHVWNKIKNNSRVITSKT